MDKVKKEVGKLLGSVTPSTGSGGSLFNTVIGLATDILSVFAVLPRQLQIIAKMIDELGGSATGAELDTYSQTSTGALFWGNSNGESFNQKPTKVLAHYVSPAFGHTAWTGNRAKSIGKQAVFTIVR
tara:strand:+ start:165 stop:545 length:381 start_codon:yes stop_codon:yes gene_type:complete